MREALVVKNGYIADKFVKEDNIHCFPIFPRYNPKTWQHPFNIEGWSYYQDCRQVNLKQFEVLEQPTPPRSNEHSEAELHQIS